MGSATKGKVLVEARIESLEDLFRSRQSGLAAEQVRTVTIPDALVDTGATILGMPRALIDQLGLRQVGTRRARTAGGVRDFDIFEAIRLTIAGRQCTVEVSQVPDDCPVLIGQIPLEALDFVVDPQGQRLIGNPDHGGEQMIDMF